MLTWIYTLMLTKIQSDKKKIKIEWMNFDFLCLRNLHLYFFQYVQLLQ